MLMLGLPGVVDFGIEIFNDLNSRHRKRDVNYFKYWTEDESMIEITDVFGSFQGSNV